MGSKGWDLGIVQSPIQAGWKGPLCLLSVSSFSLLYQLGEFTEVLLIRVYFASINVFFENCQYF